MFSNKNPSSVLSLSACQHPKLKSRQQATNFKNFRAKAILLKKGTSNRKFNGRETYPCSRQIARRGGSEDQENARKKTPVKRFEGRGRKRL
jgi:hypothetical protein